MFLLLCSLKSPSKVGSNSLVIDLPKYPSSFTHFSHCNASRSIALCMLVAPETPLFMHRFHLKFIALNHSSSYVHINLPECLPVQLPPRDSSITCSPSLQSSSISPTFLESGTSWKHPNCGSSKAMFSKSLVIRILRLFKPWIILTNQCNHHLIRLLCSQ